MSGKIVLDLCGGTGSWSLPYQEAGYDVRLITLPDYDVLTYHPPPRVHGILAAPPLYGIFRSELQSGAEGAEPGGRDEGGQRLPGNHRRMPAGLVGIGEPGRLPSGVPRKINPDFPAMGVRGPMDQEDGNMGEFHPPPKEIPAMGGCAGQTAPLHKAREEQAEFRLPPQIGPRQHSPTGEIHPGHGRRLQSDYTASVCKSLL